VPAAGEVEQDHRSVGRDEHIATWRMHDPQAKIVGICGIADVQGIGQKHAGVVVSAELLAEAR
jgi:hypothetical protein